MICITQLIYIEPGEEKSFDQFESIAIPIIAKYNGKLLLRVRPDDSSFIEPGVERPYEIHLVGFDAEEDFQRFMRDEERNSVLHLKDRSIKSSVLIRGERL